MCSEMGTVHEYAEYLKFRTIYLADAFGKIRQYIYIIQ